MGTDVDRPYANIYYTYQQCALGLHRAAEPGWVRTVEGMFGFRSVEVFDPAWSLRRSALVSPLPLVGLWLLGPIGGIAGLLGAVYWLFRLSQVDQRTVNAVAVRIVEFDLGSTDTTDTPHGDVYVRAGSVARVDRRLRLHDPVALRTGPRSIQLLIDGAHARHRWFDGSVAIDIDRAEAVGALGLVLAGDDLRVDYLLGGVPGAAPRPLAIHLHSSAGGVVSFDPCVRPTHLLVPDELLMTPRSDRT